MILASGSLGLAQWAFETRLPLRVRSSWRSCSVLRVAIPLLRASSRSMACQPTPSARRTIERIGAFASMVEASTPTRRPLTRPCLRHEAGAPGRTRASWSSSGSRARVRDSVLWSGTASLVPSFRKRRSDRLSAQRQRSRAHSPDLRSGRPTASGKIAPGRHPWPPDAARVVGRAQRLDLPVEPGFVQRSDGWDRDHLEQHERH